MCCNKEDDLFLPDEIFDLPIQINEVDYSKYFKFFTKLLLIRNTELLIAEKRKLGMIGGPVHLAVGQEAIALGISQTLNPQDFIFSAHRSHAHLLALDPSPYLLFAEVLGRRTGLSRGFGGSMHLWNGKSGFHGSVPIVSGTIPLAVGAGLASKLRSNDSIGVAYFGDGAMEEGVVHESLNLAAKLEIPVLFVCENNLFSSHLHIDERQPSRITSRFARASQVRASVVDGNNLQSVISCAENLVSYIREYKKPAFIEAFTYRLFGHVDWREDIDVGVGRSVADLEKWRGRDPLLRLKKSLSIHERFRSDLVHIEKYVDEVINKDWEKAENDLTISNQDLLRHVYISDSKDTYDL